MSRCRGCGQQISWIRTKAGKPMPVDPEPIRIVTGEGNQAFVTGDGKILRGRPADLDEVSHESGYIPHWATCPKADKFRK